MAIKVIIKLIKRLFITHMIDDALSLCGFVQKKTFCVYRNFKMPLKSSFDKYELCIVSK